MLFVAYSKCIDISCIIDTEFRLLLAQCGMYCAANQGNVFTYPFSMSMLQKKQAGELRRAKYVFVNKKLYGPASSFSPK